MALSRAAKYKEEAAKKEQSKPTSLLTNKVTRPGDAVNFPRKGDSVHIHYKCFLENGNLIDDSYNRGQPLYFELGKNQVISGFEEVILFYFIYHVNIFHLFIFT